MKKVRLAMIALVLTSTVSATPVMARQYGSQSWCSLTMNDMAGWGSWHHLIPCLSEAFYHNPWQ